MGFSIKRKNGVFQGFDFGVSKEERARRMSQKMPGAGPLHGLKVSAESKPRKNGVYQGVDLKVSNSNSRKAAAAKAAQRRTSKTPTVNSAADAKRVQTAAKSAGETKRAAERRTSTESRMKSRGQRVQSKDFKGKYWGPDQFKGNQQKIDAWKKAGKPRNADGTPKG
jgi:hypothetical protein